MLTILYIEICTICSGNCNAICVPLYFTQINNIIFLKEAKLLTYRYYFNS